MIATHAPVAIEGRELRLTPEAADAARVGTDPFLAGSWG